MILRLASWLRDGAHLWGALLYWNLRKTIYVVRGRSGRPPCQSPSDEEVVGCIGCDAVLGWDRPQRFQRVCPLLKHGDNGWRCSVLSDQVRPYWLRAFGWYGAGLLAIYLSGAVVLWGLMNLVGEARVPLWKVAWPGAWSDLAEIQSSELYRKSREEFARGNYYEALKNLEAAGLRDPDNYSAALLIAQINMFRGGYLYADTQYQNLLLEYPEHQALTAVNYQDALLSLNRMERVAEHSLMMAKLDGEHTALWVKSLLLALQVPDVAREIGDKYSVEISQLPEFAKMLVEARILEADDQTDAARELLSRPFRGPWNLQYMQEQIDHLLELAEPDLAMGLLGYYGPGLRIFESMAQQYLIEQARHDTWNALATFSSLLRNELNTHRIMRLQLLLLRSPSREAYVRLHEKLMADTKLKDQVNGAVMWITGLVCDASQEAASWKTTGQIIYGRAYPAIDEVDFLATRLGNPNSVMHIINVVDFPRDVIWELLAQMHRQRQLD